VLSGFLNLSAPCSASDLHGLVSCRLHSWGFPFRGFPSLKSVAPSSARSPLDVTSRFPLRFPQQAVFHETFPAQSPSGVYPFSESVHPLPGANPNNGADPLWGFLPSKGLPDQTIAPPSRHLLSCTLTPARSTRRFCSPLPGASEFHSPGPVACLRKDCRPSWGLLPFHSSHSLRNPSALAYRFTSDPGVRHRLLRALFELRSSQPE
jgi:hypothetical protein